MRFSLTALSCIISEFGRVTAPSYTRRVAVVTTTSSPLPDTTEGAYPATTATVRPRRPQSAWNPYRARTDPYSYAFIDSYDATTREFVSTTTRGYEMTTAGYEYIAVTRSTSEQPFTHI